MLSAGAERDFMQDCTKNELMMAVRTVMMNWMMVFQVFMSFSSFIIVVINDLTISFFSL